MPILDEDDFKQEQRHFLEASNIAPIVGIVQPLLNAALVHHRMMIADEVDVTRRQGVKTK